MISPRHGVIDHPTGAVLGHAGRRPRTAAGLSTPSGTSTDTANRPSSAAAGPVRRSPAVARISRSAQFDPARQQLPPAGRQFTDMPDRTTFLPPARGEKRPRQPDAVTGRRGHRNRPHRSASPTRTVTDARIDSRPRRGRPGCRRDPPGRHRGRTGTVPAVPRDRHRRRASRPARGSAPRRSARPPDSPVSGEATMLRTRSWRGWGSSPALSTSSTSAAETAPDRSVATPRELQVRPGRQLQVTVGEPRRCPTHQLQRLGGHPPSGHPQPQQRAVGGPVRAQHAGAAISLGARVDGANSHRNMVSRRRVARSDPTGLTRPMAGLGQWSSMPRVALLSTSDTDLLSGRASHADYALANPARLDVQTELPAVLEGADLVIVRILGTARSWQDGLDAVRASGLPTVVLGGEQTPDAELMRLSTVPIGVAAQAHQYLAEGGPGNLGPAARLLLRHRAADRRGFRAADAAAVVGTARSARAARRIVPRGRGSASCTTGRIRRRATPRSSMRCPTPSKPWCPRTFPPRPRCRCSAPRCAAHRTTCSNSSATFDALIVTVLAAGGTKPGAAAAGGDDEAWDVTALAALDIPILQGLCLTWSRQRWADSDEGLSPLDVATQVAVPEFDGRIITVPFSFKETDADGLPLLRRRPGTLRQGRRHRRRPRPAPAHPAGAAADRDHAVRLPDQALPDRQRRRPGHPGLGDPDAARDAGGRL